MLGLERGAVRVVAYQTVWHYLFKQERRVLHEHIGHHVLDIQHVGSTAVPGLDAKPIVDIAVAVPSAEAISQRCALVLSPQIGRRVLSLRGMLKRSGESPPAAVFRRWLNLYEHRYKISERRLRTPSRYHKTFLL